MTENDRGAARHQSRLRSKDRATGSIAASICRSRPSITPEEVEAFQARIMRRSSATRSSGLDWWLDRNPGGAQALPSLLQPDAARGSRPHRQRHPHLLRAQRLRDRRPLRPAQLDGAARREQGAGARRCSPWPSSMPVRAACRRSPRRIEGHRVRGDTRSAREVPGRLGAGHRRLQVRLDFSTIRSCRADEKATARRLVPAHDRRDPALRAASWPSTARCLLKTHRARIENMLYRPAQADVADDHALLPCDEPAAPKAFARTSCSARPGASPSPTRSTRSATRWSTARWKRRR